MNIINFSGILQNFGKNLNFGNFQAYCRVNSNICVYVSTYTYLISVLFHTFSSYLAKLQTLKVLRTRQIIRYRATATLWRPQIKQYTVSKERGGGTKPTGTSYNLDKEGSGASDGRKYKEYSVSGAKLF